MGIVTVESKEGAFKYINFIDRLLGSCISINELFRQIKDLTLKEKLSNEEMEEIEVSFIKLNKELEEILKGKKRRKYKVEIEERIKNIEERQKVIKEEIDKFKQDLVNYSGVNYYSIIGYALVNNIKSDLYSFTSMNTRAYRLCRTKSIKIGKMVDSVYGYINTYPIEILEEVFDGIGVD